MTDSRSSSTTSTTSTHDRINNLTRRELEVLQLVSEGLGNKAIGEALFVSGETVKSHLSSIFRKLRVGNRADAAAVAEQHPDAFSGIA